MTQQDKNTIQEWLSGPRDFTEGAALYRRYGSNLMLKRQFASDKSPMARAVLEDELRKLAGLTEFQFVHLPRKAKAAGQPKTANRKPTTDNRQPISSEDQNKIRFREKYPFLAADDCPEILKILVADMFTAYGKAHESFNTLQAIPEDKSDATTLPLCQNVVENYLENRQIFDELEHYRLNNTLLGVHPKVKGFIGIEDTDPDYFALDTSELVKKLNSANANVSKARKAVKTAKDDKQRADAEERLEKWKARLECIRTVVELRKKN